MIDRQPVLPDYWSISADELFARLETSPSGLSSAEAERRLREWGPSDLGDRRTLSRLRVLVRQIRSPLLWLLIFAAFISIASKAWSDAGIVLAIVLATVVIGYLREYRAERAVLALRARVRTTATVLRDGLPVAVPRSTVVTGDVMVLSAGSLVPADAVVLESSDCFVSEAALTGESFPVQKGPCVLQASTGLAGRRNCVFLGTNVRSGTARCVSVATGISSLVF